MLTLKDKIIIGIWIIAIIILLGLPDKLISFTTELIVSLILGAICFALVELLVTKITGDELKEKLEKIKINVWVFRVSLFFLLCIIVNILLFKT